ncbi:MAG: tRNA (adenosine(37)-N6)-threonylcarbamoyltransferase complex ATPase subunit type 1 TsaE [Phycisphaerae bacterium]
MTEAKVLTTRGPAGTRALGRRLAKRLARGDCVALIGPLGAGKTVLVRGIAEGLGVGDDRLVSSPTYVLVHEYPADVPLYHVDLYRMVDPAAELADLGLDEMLADGVVVIEWADRAGGALPRRRWEIEIEIIGERGRRFGVRRLE